MNKTYFGLLAEFGAAELPLEAVAQKYFGMTAAMAARRAALQQLPVPVYRAGSQKSPWLVSANELANWLDACKRDAEIAWQKMNA